MEGNHRLVEFGRDQIRNCPHGYEPLQIGRRSRDFAREAGYQNLDFLGGLEERARGGRQRDTPCRSDKKLSSDVIFEAFETRTYCWLLLVERTRSRADTAGPHDAEEQLDQIPVEIAGEELTVL